MRKLMSISASKIDWKQVAKFGSILTATVAITLLLCSLLIFPWMKNDIKNQLLYGEITLDENGTEEATFDKKEQEYVTAEFEAELKMYLEEYFQNTDVDAYFGEDGIEKLVEQITLKLKESDSTILSKEKIEALISKELEKVIVKENESNDEALNALKQELIYKIDALASSGNYDAIIEKHSTTLSTIVTDISTTQNELDVLQESLLYVMGNLGDCIVAYNAEDGHFYITYQGGADSVTKKLDYAP